MTKKFIYVLTIISAILTLSGCTQQNKPDFKKAPVNLKDFLANINSNENYEGTEDFEIVETVTGNEDVPVSDDGSQNPTNNFKNDYFSIKASDIWKIDYSDDYSCSYVFADPETDEESSVYVSIFFTYQGGSEYTELDEYVDIVKEVNDADYKMIAEKESTFAGYKNKELFYEIYIDDTTQLYSRLMHIQTKEHLYPITIIYQNKEPAKHIQLAIDRLLEGLSIT
ncbi:MAG: hypothetical protein E7490_00825 [Ruminococcaceae bacterium]|nr:hypothetical protein [Oscillospiraceae bacterium]